MNKYTSLIFIFLFAASCLAEGLSFSLSVPKTIYYEEEEVVLNLIIENKSSEKEKIKLPYLQPKENNFLFIGKDFELCIEGLPKNESRIPNFTNHIPPEPKPGFLEVTLNLEEEISRKIPFTYYYYPVELPQEFEVKLIHKNIPSNTVRFRILPSEGEKKQESILINENFSQGESYPYGWKIQAKKVVWDKEKHLLTYSLDKKTAYGEGLWVYSIFHKIKSPSSFTLKARAKSTGPEIIVFVEGWGLVNGRKRRLERNECFMHPEGDSWQDYQLNLKFINPSVRWLRVKPYTYLKPGNVWFDSIELLPLKK